MDETTEPSKKRKAEEIDENGDKNSTSGVAAEGGQDKHPADTEQSAASEPQDSQPESKGNQEN